MSLLNRLEIRAMPKSKKATEAIADNTKKDEISSSDATGKDTQPVEMAAVIEEDTQPTSTGSELVPHEGTKPATEEDPIVTEAVNHINTIIGDNLVNTAIQIGNYVLEKFYGNNIEDAKSRSPVKQNSFRKLQNHPDLKIHYKTLNQMVNVAIQENLLLKELGEDQVKMLTYSHKIELLPLKDEIKIEYAKKCIEEHLSINGLRKAISSKTVKNDNKENYQAIIQHTLDRYYKDDLSEKDFKGKGHKSLDKLVKDIEKYIEHNNSVNLKLSSIKEKLTPIIESKKNIDK